MDRSSLEVLLAQGLSLEEIARRYGKHPSTVGHWVKKHGLEAAHRVKHAPRDGLTREQLEPLVDQGASIRGIAVELNVRRRRKVKRILVEEAGGACCICGYRRCIAALQFHHRDRSTKAFALAKAGAVSIERLRDEATKCVLLCSNCHAEVEAGVAAIPR
jgi:IS30 family transposase